MLVHFVKPEFTEDGIDYEHTKVLAAQKVKSYDKFIKFIRAMIDHEVIIDKEWYTIDSYNFSFPSDNEHMPCLIVYVVEYFG